MKNTNNQIKLGAILSYVAIAFNIISGLLYTPWMISQIGQANYGLYTLAISLISLFVMDFGMSAAVTRFVSKYKAENDSDAINNFLGIVYKLYLLIDAVIFIVLIGVYLFIDTIYANLTPDELSTFKVLYMVVGLFSVISFPFTNLNGILTAHEKFIQLKLCDLLNKILVIVLTVFGLLMGWGVFALVSVYAIAGLILILVKFIIIKSTTTIKVNFNYKSKKIFKEIFGFSIWTTVSSIMQRLIFNITPSIIAAVSVTGAIGTAVFGLASTIENYVFIFANAINGMFMPRISRIIAADKKSDELMPLMEKIGRIQMMIVGFITIGFISFGKSFIVDIWHKQDFELSYYCAILLILPSLFYLPMQIANTTLVVENKVKLQSYVFMVMGITNLICSLILSKFFGAMGASISIFIAYMIRTLLISIVHYKVLKIDMIYFLKKVILKFSAYLLIMLAVGIILEYYMPLEHGYLRFVINGLVFCIVFGVVFWRWVLNDYEKGIFLSVAKKLKR